MHAFVTGGSGFVGRALLAALAARGDRARALARSEGAAATVRALGGEVVAGGLDDEAALAAGMRGCEVVYHAAAKVEVWGRRADFEAVTIEGTRRVVSAARAAGVRRLVHVSTEAVLVDGAPLVQVDEARPLPARPLGLYPWSKGRAEALVREANGEGGLETVVVRPRAIWGRGDTVLVPRLADLARRGQFAWIGGGRHLTSTTHVRNVAHGMMLAAARGRGGEVYFVTDGDPVEFRAFYTELVRRQTGVDLGGKELPLWVARAVAAVAELAWRALPLRGEPPLIRTVVHLIGEEVTVVDAKARRELGYVPIVTRAEGLAELGAAA